MFEEGEEDEEVLALVVKRASFIAALNLCGITHANLIRYLTEVQLLETIDDFVLTLLSPWVKWQLACDKSSDFRMTWTVDCMDKEDI